MRWRESLFSWWHFTAAVVQQWHNHSHSSPAEPVDWEVIPRGGHSNATAHYAAGLEAGNRLRIFCGWAHRQTSFLALRFSMNVKEPCLPSTLIYFSMLYLHYFLCFTPEIYLVLCKKTYLFDLRHSERIPSLIYAFQRIVSGYCTKK